MTSNKPSSALSVQVVFGEKTSLPITVNKALVRATDPVPFVNKASVHLELHLTNAAVAERDVAARLRLELPIGATVKKFELHRNNQWYPATAVPRQKAKAVVYKEKEKGRAAAAVSNSTLATNVFEIEISPLPYKKEIPCRLEILTEGDAQELLQRLSTDTATTVEVESLPSPMMPSSDIGAVVGSSFGKTHFVCHVPSISTSSDADTANPLGHVAIFWDTSASMKEGIDQRCLCLQELVVKADTKTIELFKFSMGPPEKVGTYINHEDLLKAIQAMSYDGGTDLTLLPGAISRLATEALDALLVFTDGVDNLGRTPEFDNSIPFPVHCIADTSANINMPSLKAIAAASVNATGTVLTNGTKNYLQGILFPRPVLGSITVNQDDAAFMEETDDGFRCIPDYRLKTLNQPIPAEGLRIS